MTWGEWWVNIVIVGIGLNIASHILIRTTSAAWIRIPVMLRINRQLAAIEAKQEEARLLKLLSDPVAMHLWFRRTGLVRALFGGAAAVCIAITIGVEWTDVPGDWNTRAHWGRVLNFSGFYLGFAYSMVFFLLVLGGLSEQKKLEQMKMKLDASITPPATPSNHPD